MSNITLNIVEPGSGPVVPDTGLFTAGIRGPEATAIGAVIVLAIATIVVAILYKKHKKQNKTTRLVHLVDNTKAIIKSKKRVTASLTALALLASAGTFSALLSTANKNNTNALEGEEETITPVVSNEELTIELSDEPVFAILPVDITVEQATEAGYTLTAYTDNTDLISTTDSSKVIPMVAVEGDELTSLTDNTYGLSLVQPETKDDEAYTSLSTDADNPTPIAEKEEPTEAEDTTTIYYAFYITPDTPYGTYTGSDITYEAKNNIATVTFDGNGKFYFDNDTSKTTNAVSYVSGKQSTPQYSHTPNINDAGVQNGSYPLGEAATSIITIPGFQKIHITLSYGDGIGYYSDDWVSLWPGSNPTYTAADNYYTGLNMGSVNNGKYIFNSSYSPTPITTVSGDIDGEESDYAVTFAYKTTTESGGSGEHTGYGYYAVVTGYDPNEAISGEYEVPEPNGTYRFLGWSTDKDATTPTYTSQEDIMRSLDLTNGDVTLYAISEPGIVVSYNGNGADTTTNMDNVEQYTTDLTSTEQQVDLLASNFQRDGYGFVGWSTDNEAWDHLTNESTSDDPTIYGPNQTITVDPTASTKLTLYAIWADLATDKNGEELTFQTENLLTTQLSDNENDTLANKDNGYVTALKDERNGEVYAVAKLADGNYWMIENLRLDDSATLTKDNGETKGNTNNPNLPLTNNYAEQITSNKLSASSDTWCTNNDSACLDQSIINTNNIANTTTSPAFSQDFTSSTHSNFDGNIASYSNYYNWYSATAGNGTSSVSSGTVAGDICPAGWKLPIGKNTTYNGSFYQLNQALNNGSTDATASNRWRSFPNNFVYSGYWDGSSANNRGGSGRYWSSTAGNTGNAYGLYFNSGRVYPGTDRDYKYYGYSVRCVAPTE